MSARLAELDSPEYIKKRKGQQSNSYIETKQLSAIAECQKTMLFVQNLMLEQHGDEKTINSPTDRLNKIMSKLDKLGVFYGTDYSGDYHNKYPHELYSFAIELDKHRGGFESHILKEGEIESTLTIVGGDNPTEMIIELLESSYTKILELIKQSN